MRAAGPFAEIMHVALALSEDTTGKRELLRAIAKARADLSASPAQPVQEPVAWVCSADIDQARERGGDDISVSPRIRPELGMKLALYTHPTPAPVLRLSIERKIGMYGAAYGGPHDARAYTYQHQPSNVPAWRIGQAADAAAKITAGDFIDRGLGLLRYLQDAGFGVFSLVKDEAASPAQPVQEPVAGNRLVQFLYRILRDHADVDMKSHLAQTVHADATFSLPFIQLEAEHFARHLAHPTPAPVADAEGLVADLQAIASRKYDMGRRALTDADTDVISTAIAALRQQPAPQSDEAVTLRAELAEAVNRAEVAEYKQRQDVQVVQPMIIARAERAEAERDEARAALQANGEQLARYSDCLMAVSGHLDLPHAETGPCDDPEQYDRELTGLDELYRTTEAERIVHSEARFKAEAALQAEKDHADKGYAWLGYAKDHLGFSDGMLKALSDHRVRRAAK